MGHVHADLMLKYAQDAQETSEPWELWEMRLPANKTWSNCTDGDMHFSLQFEYRRKPKMISVTLMNGEVVSWPEPHRTELEYGDSYFYVAMDGSVIVEEWDCLAWDSDILSNGWLYLTEEAAKQHATALHKINTQGMK